MTDREQQLPSPPTFACPRCGTESTVSQRLPQR